MRRKVIAIMGRWSIYGEYNNEVFYCEQKFSLKTNLHVYTNKNKHEEVLVAKTKQIIDFSAAYDILDPRTNEKIGAVKRKGWKSLWKDEWIIMDKYDRDIGLVREDNLALPRRLSGSFSKLLFPKKYFVFIEETPVGVFQANRNPFVWKTSIDFSQDARNLLDKRIGIALALLMCAVGERQR
jgi:hypothetical protein